MKLALITAHYPPATVPCGVGDYSRRLREAFAAQRHVTLIITSRRSLTREPGTFPLADRWDGKDLTRVARLIGRERPDVVLLQYTPEHFGFGVAFKLLPFLIRLRAPGPRVLTTFHTLVGGRRRAHLSAVLLAAGSHGVISTYEELTRLFRHRLPWWAGKLREIPIGSNLEPSDMPRSAAARCLRARLRLDAGVPLVGCFGFPGGRKGMDVLFRSAACHARTPFHLVLATHTRQADRPVRLTLERLASDLGITHRVHWLDALPSQEAARALAGCDLYAVPYDDGVSLRRGTLMAGWRQGLAIVTTHPHFPSPLFSDGDTMLLVPPRDPATLGAAIERVLQDQDLRCRLEAASQQIAGHFSWDTIATAHLDFARALGARDGGG